MLVKLLNLIRVLLVYFINFHIITVFLSEDGTMHESSIRVNVLIQQPVDGFTRVCCLLLLQEPEVGCSDDEL